MDYQGTNKPKKVEPDSTPKSDKKLEKVVSGEVVTRKRPLGQRMKDVFLGGEFKSAAQYIAAEVLLPAFRNLLVDATTKGVERVVYGESTQSRGRQQDYRPRVTYNDPIRRYPTTGSVTQRGNLPDQPSQRARHDRTELILSSRADAETVLERLSDIIDRYAVASLADLHELAGIPTTHVDNKWGWESIRFAEIRQIREGYLLDLPPAEAI